MSRYVIIMVMVHLRGKGSTNTPVCLPVPTKDEPFLNFSSDFEARTTGRNSPRSSMIGSKLKGRGLKLGFSGKVEAHFMSTGNIQVVQDASHVLV